MQDDIGGQRTNADTVNAVLEGNQRDRVSRKRSASKDPPRSDSACGSGTENRHVHAHKQRQRQSKRKSKDRRWAAGSGSIQRRQQPHAANSYSNECPTDAPPRKQQALKPPDRQQNDDRPRVIGGGNVGQGGIINLDSSDEDEGTSEGEQLCPGSKPIKPLFVCSSLHPSVLVQSTH